MNKQGFTLMEMLVAIMLMGILLTGVIGVVPQFTKNIRANEYKRSSIEEIYTSLTMIENDVNNYYRNFNGEFMTLKMQTLKNLPKGSHKKIRSPILDIGYSIETKLVDGKSQSTLFRLEKGTLMESGVLKTKLMTADLLSFGYLNDSATWEPAWRSEQQKAPVALRVIVEKNGHKWTREMPFIVRTWR